MTGEPTHITSEMAQCTVAIYISYRLKSEVSITLRCQLCSNCHTAFWIKNCSKSISTIYAYRKKEWCRAPCYINYHPKSEVSITLHRQLCSTGYTAVQIQNCSKSTSAIKIATMTNTDYCLYKGKPSRAIAKSTLFAVSKDEWDTKDAGKSMKNALYVLRNAKRHLLGQSNVEQWKNQASSLSRCRVTLV